MARLKEAADQEGQGRKRKHATVVVHQTEVDHETPAKRSKNVIRSEKDTIPSEDDYATTSAKRQKSARRGSDGTQSSSEKTTSGELDTSRPSAIYKPSGGRDWTLSIALPGSFINNGKVPQQKSDLAARIARAAAVFCVDEVVIFDDDPEVISDKLKKFSRGGRNVRGLKAKQEALSRVPDDQEAYANPEHFLYHVLSYLECPPHLQKALFPLHPNLSFAGSLPSLDMPHHMKADEWNQYRDGVALPQGRGGYKFVDCGLRHPVKFKSDLDVKEGERVTVKFNSAEPPPSWPNLSERQIEDLEPEPVGPSTPREEAGYYWGFSTRYEASLSAVLKASPFEGGYSYVVGTSERGVPLNDVLPDALTSAKSSKRSRRASSGGRNKLPDKCKHLLLCFGGVSGLEPAVANDPELRELGFTKEKAHELFDAWVNLVPDQGSRTIRLEEAVWLGLMGFYNYMQSQYQQD